MRDLQKDFDPLPLLEEKNVVECLTHFKRIEKKYLVNSIVAEILINRISSFMPKDPKSILSPHITSIYFDNPEWKCYTEHISKKHPRFKVRIRQYGNEGFASSTGFLEIKSKSKGVTSKERVKISFPPFKSGNEYLYSYGINSQGNGIIPDVRYGVYYRITDAINNYGLEPVSKVEYNRQAFELKNRTLRITFDSGLEFHSIRNSHSVSSAAEFLLPENFVIMEVKNAGHMPSWLISLLKSYKLNNAHFSKYCSSVKSLYLPEKTVSAVNNKIFMNNTLTKEYGTTKELIVANGVF